jgi:glycogen synthase
LNSVSADYLFEASWEVCNKVGGIYTVVKSKAALINEAYPHYILVGPYIQEKAEETFKEEPLSDDFKSVFEKLKQQGIVCHYGTWQIKGKPRVILIEPSQSLADQKNEFKKQYWEKFQVDSLNSHWDFEEPLLWATAVGKLLQEFCAQHNDKKTVLHCHEWMAGFALLYAKMNNVNVATVFTTHATMLGRSLAGSGRPLYDELEHLNPEQEAQNSGVMDKFTTEKACAHQTDIFTTVSEITALEAEKVLGRKADVLVLNGLDIDKFPTFEETSIKHRENRDLIRKFVSYFFFPHYYFDLEHTLFFFIVGRYEYKNKGIDIFTKALAKLNDRMKQEKVNRTIVVFYWIPREVHSAKKELSTNKINFHQLEHFIERNSAIINTKIMAQVMGCNVTCFSKPNTFEETNLFDENFLIQAKKLRLHFAQKGNPLLVTHNLPNEENDPILKGLLDVGLDNKEDDRVKVIHYPVYLTGVDGLIDLPYYDCIMGCHLGLFPSYYEPWGYTPLESAALGVPSLTTDLGGFGRFMLQKDKGSKGIFVLKRFHVGEEETVNHFTEMMYEYAKLTPKGRVEQKMAAKELAALADWKELVKNYFDAHNQAVKRVYG